MTIKSQNKKATYADYLKINDGKQYEVISGELKMVPAPSFKHQNIISNLHGLIWEYLQKNNIGIVCPSPVDVVLSSNNVIQPDIVYISRENTGIIDEEKGITGTPDLVVEIISRSSQYRDRYEKKDLYKEFGVKEYWIVDQFASSVEILILNEKKEYELLTEGYLGEEGGNRSIKSNVISGLEIYLENIFKKNY
jgi:Uma2 family endonuclease